MASPKHLLYKLIIKRCIDNKKISWAKEVKMAKKLLEKFPEEAFWQNVIVKKRDSLVYFLSYWGEQELKKQEIDFKAHLEPPKYYEIEEEKQGEDKEFKPTINTLKEFLKNG